MLAVATPNVGRWYSPGGNTEGDSNLTLLTDKVYYRPFFVTRAVRFDRLALRADDVPTSLATCRLGVYKALANGLPGRLIVSTPNISWDAVVDLVGTVTMTESLFPGTMYYLAVILSLPNDASLDFRGTAPGGASTSGVCGVTAAESIDGVVAEPNVISHAAVGWSAMPDPAIMTAPVYEAMTPGPPQIGARIATGYGGEGPGHAPFNYPWNAANKRWRVANILCTGVNRTTGIVVDGTVYFAPFFVTVASQIALAAIDITTGGAGSAARIGIYSSHPSTGLPDALLDETASFATTAIAVVEEAIGPVVLAAKTNYWMAFAASGGTPTVRRMSWAQSGAISSHLGWDTVAACIGNERPTRSAWSVAGFVAATGFDDPATGFVYGSWADDMVLIAYELKE